jgi:hypothetical protein
VTISDSTTLLIAALAAAWAIPAFAAVLMTMLYGR